MLYFHHVFGEEGQAAFTALQERWKKGIYTRQDAIKFHQALDKLKTQCEYDLYDSGILHGTTLSLDPQGAYSIDYYEDGEDQPLEPQA